MDNKRIRIGRIKFTNVWPIFYHFPQERFKAEAELSLQVPSGLNKGMARGEIDIAAVSSFAYGEFHKECMLYPDLSVSTLGKVNSIFLFHRKPLEEIGKGVVYLPTTSATSINLLKILLARFYGAKPEYRYSEPDLDGMMAAADAALLIGDDAIKAHRTNTEFQVTDLGELWHRHTGHWMTYAVWAVRKQTAERHPQLVADIFRAFLDSKKRGLADPSEMIEEAVRSVGGTEAYWRAYFANICYDFGFGQWTGLRLYFDYAYQLGLLPEPVNLKIWNAKSVIQVSE